MRMLLIEETSPGRYRLANGPMTLEVFGSSLEEVLIQALKTAGVWGDEAWDVFRGSHTVAEVLDSLMGMDRPEVEGHSV